MKRGEHSHVELPLFTWIVAVHGLAIACSNSSPGITVSTIADSKSQSADIGTDAKSQSADIGDSAAYFCPTAGGDVAGGNATNGVCPPGWLATPNDNTVTCLPEYPVWGIGPSIPTSFTVHGDGTVTHMLTGLQWQQDSSPAGELSWIGAKQHCQALVLGGHGDWRLPSTAELSSTMILGRGPDQKGYDLPFSPPLPFGKPSVVNALWSATEYVTDLTQAWNCGPDWFIAPSGKDSTKVHSRCVRGTTTACEPAQRFSRATPGVVHDNATGLTWQQNPEWKKLTDVAATEHCAKNAAGLPGTGWHLPSIRELESLILRDRHSPAADIVAFPALALSGSGPLLFWSATTPLGDRPNFVVNFQNGVIGTVWMGCEMKDVQCFQVKHVWCVR